MRFHQLFNFHKRGIKVGFKDENIIAFVIFVGIKQVFNDKTIGFEDLNRLFADMLRFFELF